MTSKPRFTLAVFEVFALQERNRRKRSCMHGCMSVYLRFLVLAGSVSVQS